jgi:DNA-binding transcriptional regulator LsrR (DeoR family)
MLEEARNRGIVSIKLNTKIASRARLSRALSMQFSLSSVITVPDIPGGALEQRLGEAAALALADDLAPGDVIGVAWGRTVLAAAHAISHSIKINSLTVVQVCGSPAGLSKEFSPELCSSLLASRLSARCVNLLAPAILSTPDLRDKLMAEPPLIKQLSTMRSANRILFGVGDTGKNSTIRATEFLDAPIIDAFVKDGAAAAIIGRFIDRNGKPLRGTVYDRMVGMTLEEMKEVPYRLCVAGGSLKLAAIQAALRGGYATHLVTDQKTAETLLKAGKRAGNAVASGVRSNL